MYEMPQNTTTFVDLVSWTNSITGGLFVNMAMITFWFVVFFSMKQYLTRQAFTVASWTCMITSIFFRMMGLVDDLMMFVFIIMVGISVVWLSWATD
jgi:hypothetical protein